MTELMSRGELGTLLANKSVELSDFMKLRMALDIAVGMNWLHTSRPRQFIHRDLKPSNLLVDSNYRIKICDFGFCVCIIKQHNRLLTLSVATERSKP